MCRKSKAQHLPHTATLNVSHNLKHLTRFITFAFFNVGKDFLDKIPKAKIKDNMVSQPLPKLKILLSSNEH